MKKNMGNTDKAIRLILAVIILILVFATNLISGTLSYILTGLAAIFILTSLISFCPLYKPFGIDTSKQKD